MQHDVRADPADLAQAAGLSLTEATTLFDALRLARGGLTWGADTMGAAAAAAAVAAAHIEVVEAAGSAVEALISVLEADVDALYQTAFAYQQADQEAAEDLARQDPAGPI